MSDSENKKNWRDRRRLPRPSVEAVSEVLSSMFADRPHVGNDGPVVLMTFNGYFLTPAKWERLRDPLVDFFRRAHVILLQETNADTLKMAAKDLGYKRDASHRNEREQAVGGLYHPRVHRLGGPRYHDQIVEIDGRPELKTSLRPAVQRLLRDMTSNLPFTVINWHTKSLLGGPEETAPVRAEQTGKLVTGIHDFGTWGHIILGGDFNAFLESDETREYDALVEDGFTLLRTDRPTYRDHQFDGFFVKSLGDKQGAVWVPELPGDEEGQRIYRAVSDHRPVFFDFLVEENTGVVS